MKTSLGSRTATMLVLALATCMTVSVRADEAEDKAVKNIEKMGGIITRDEKAKGKPIVTVGITRDNVTDALLKHLAGLKTLQTLDLSFTKVTDAGLKHLAGLKELLAVGLRGTKVTDAGLKELAGLKKLQTLGLAVTKVTDAGL